MSASAKLIWFSWQFARKSNQSKKFSQVARKCTSIRPPLLWWSWWSCGKWTLFILNLYSTSYRIFDLFIRGKPNFKQVTARVVRKNIISAHVEAIKWMNHINFCSPKGLGPHNGWVGGWHGSWMICVPASQSIRWSLLHWTQYQSMLLLVGLDKMLQNFAELAVGGDWFALICCTFECTRSAEGEGGIGIDL